MTSTPSSPSPVVWNDIGRESSAPGEWPRQGFAHRETTSSRLRDASDQLASSSRVLQHAVGNLSARLRRRSRPSQSLLRESNSRPFPYHAARRMHSGSSLRAATGISRRGGRRRALQCAPVGPRTGPAPCLTALFAATFSVRIIARLARARTPATRSQPIRSTATNVSRWRIGSASVLRAVWWT